MPLIIEPPKKIIADLGLEEDGEIHAFFTNACALHMDKYVPMDEGILAGTVVQNGVTTSNVTTNTITYDQDYALYQWRGERADGTHKIQNYSTEKHSLAGSHWEKRMWTAEREEIEKEVQEELNKRCK